MYASRLEYPAPQKSRAYARKPTALQAAAHSSRIKKEETACE